MRTRWLAVLVAPAMLGFGQASAAFEFATIKPTDPQNPVASASGFTPRRFLGTGTLRDFVRLAYEVQESQISGGPGWFGISKFDIDGRPAQTATPVQMKAMLRVLLADRFKLVVRHETRDLPIYTLTVAKKGSKLTAADGSRGMSVGPGRVSGQWPLSELAKYFSQTLGRMVLDQTQLTGVFEIKLEWMPDEDSVFTAIQEQLGLRLESTKGPVDVLVIDRAEKPADN